MHDSIGSSMTSQTNDHGEEQFIRENSQKKSSICPWLVMHLQEVTQYVEKGNI